jgi:hypothetical protein
MLYTSALSPFYASLKPFGPSFKAKSEEEELESIKKACKMLSKGEKKAEIDAFIPEETAKTVLSVEKGMPILRFFSQDYGRLNMCLASSVKDFLEQGAALRVQKELKDIRKASETNPYEHTDSSLENPWK